MISGSNTYEGVNEARNADFNVATESAGSRASPHRKISPFNGVQRGVTSNTSVHELLECPVCMNIMYPPIHQVKFVAIYVCNLDVLLPYISVSPPI